MDELAEITCRKEGWHIMSEVSAAARAREKRAARLSVLIRRFRDAAPACGPPPNKSAPCIVRSCLSVSDSLG